MTDPHASTSQDDAQHVLSLLTRQRDLYRQLHELSRRQADLIEQGQTETLLQVLSQRQGLVQTLGELSEQIAPHRSGLSELASRLPNAQRDELRTVVDEVQTLLQGIIDRDEQDRAAMQTAKQGVSTQMSQATRAGSAMAAYNPGRAASGYQKPAAPRFTDAQG